MGVAKRKTSAELVGPGRSSAKKKPSLAGIAHQAKSGLGKVIVLPRNTPQEPKLLSETEREFFVVQHREKGRKIARAILRKWQSRLDLDEIQSIVDISLCEAARRFDPSRGVHFVTFLYYHLKGNLIRAIDTSVWNTLLPSIADGSAEQTSRELPFTARDLSEALTSEAVEIPEDSLYRQEIAALSQKAREQLDPLEREVVERIYIRGQQLIDVASSLGYSRCHISRIKKRALLFLHRELREGVEYAGYGPGLSD